MTIDETLLEILKTTPVCGCGSCQEGYLAGLRRAFDAGAASAMDFSLEALQKESVEKFGPIDIAGGIKIAAKADVDIGITVPANFPNDKWAEARQFFLDRIPRSFRWRMERERERAKS